MRNYVITLYKQQHLAIITLFQKNKQKYNLDTFYRPISFFFALAEIIGKTIIQNITDNIPYIITQHVYKGNHSTDTLLDYIINTISRGFNQYQPPERIITSLHMSKALEIVDTHH